MRGVEALTGQGRDQFGMMVALQPPIVTAVPFSEALGAPRTVPLDCDTIMTARDIGVCLGD